MLSASKPRFVGAYVKLRNAVTFNISAKEYTSGHAPSESQPTPFQRAKIGTFFQEKPILHNPYLSDAVFQSYLKRHLPSQYFQEIHDDLSRFGRRVCNEIDDKGLECEEQPPTLTHFDAWGNRIDRVNTCDGWKFMKNVSAEEGLIAIGYERKYEEASRLYQMSKLFIIGSSCGLYSCPLAMTDGAAKVLETIFPNVATDDGVMGNAYRRLTSRDHNKFWTSGQWMTERRGGSDVANSTETVAHRQDNGTYKLYGYKWFTSATDADMVMTLARIVEDGGSPSSKLSLFLLETKGEYGQQLSSGLNGLHVQRLKDKLGTRQLPTAEMLLDGTTAYQIGERDRGIRNISGMLSISRLYNCFMGLTGARRIVQLAVDYSRRRYAFGAKLCENSLHLQTLARMEIEVRASFLLTFDLVRILGLEEHGNASDEELGVMRLMLPVCKLYTAKQAIKVCSEGLESFGGMGYLEDSGLPRILRDAQILSIWEGTTNILGLDVLRAITTSKGKVVEHFFSRVSDILEKVKICGNPDLVHLTVPIEAALNSLSSFLDTVSAGDGHELTTSARDLSYSFAKIYMAALMLDHAAWKDADATDLYVAQRWCTRDLCPVSRYHWSGSYSKKATAIERDLFKSYQGEQQIP